MADKRDQWADSFSAEPQSGWLTGFLADEDKGTRRLLWRLGSWGVVAVGAVAIAVLASQYEIQLRRDQSAASDALGRQAQLLQQLTREAQAENRRLSQAIDTLNSDRDRLFSRVTSVEKGLESATGSVQARPNTPAIFPREPTPQIAAPATQPAPVAAVELKTAATLPDTSNIPSKPLDTVMSEPTVKIATDTAATPRVIASEATAPKSDVPVLSEPATSSAAEPPSTAPGLLEPAPPVLLAAIAPAPAEIATPVARTEFGVDIGTANSVDGLRGLWRGLSRTPALAGLRPVIVVRERSNGLGMQLRLVAGPLTDAAAAARICATLAESKRACETSVFDGQRLALKDEVTPVAPRAAAAPAAPKPPRPAQRRAAPKPEQVPAPKPEQRSEQPPPVPAEEPQAQAPARTPSLSSMLGFSRE